MSVYGTPAVKIVLNTTDPSGSFILNQYAGPQTGNFWVTGRGRVDTKLGVGGLDPVYALDVSTTDPIAGRFTGRVIGADAVNNNEFITKAQMDATVGTPPTLLATQVGYGSTGNTLTGSGGITFAVGTGKLTLNTTLGRLIQLGGPVATATPNPVQIHMGASYSDTAGSNLKLVVFDNNIGGIAGLGFAGSSMEYVVPASSSHKFYSGAFPLMSMSTLMIGVHQSLKIVWDDNIAPKMVFYGGQAGGPATLNLGVDTGGVLYTNVPTGGKHALRINGVDAFTISGVGAAITTVSQDDTKTAVMVWDATDKLVRWRAASSIVNGLTAITANNGLTATTISNVQLGAASVGAASPLLHDTFINTDVYKLEVNGGQLDILRGSLMAVNSGGGTAFYVSAYGGANANSNAHAMRIDNLFTSTNTVEPILQILRSTAASGGVSGVGGSIDYRAAFGVTGGNNPSTTTNRLISKWTTAGSLSQFIITGVGPGGMADLFTLHGTGSTQLNKYGIGTFPGTAAFNLAVDSTGKLIEVSAAAAPPLAHALLGVSHSDTVGSAPVRGGLIVANATPAWAQLAKGTTNQILQAGATDVGWVTISGDIGLVAGVATIPVNTVTYAKMQDISQASVLLGRGSAGGAGDPQEILLDVKSLVMNLTTVGVKIQMSIDSDTSGLKLVNDAAAPGNAKYYGTGSTGTKGFFDLPTSIVEGEWNFSTSTVMTDPSSGKFRTDQITFSASTTMVISDISAQGIDRTPILQAIQPNDLIYIQDKSNAGNWVRYRVTGPPVDNTTYWTIPVASIEIGGVLPTNNTPCIFHFTGQPSAGAMGITQLTTDVLAGPGSGVQVATIAANAVTYAKMQDVTATARFIGRISAGAGDPEELTGAQATSLLSLLSTTTTAQGLVVGSNNVGTNYFLRADNTWQTISGSVVNGAALTKTDDTNVTLTLGGTPATALLRAASITVGWAGTLAPGRGGTGLATYVLGDILYASAANVLSALAGNTVNAKRFLSQTGTGTISAAPVWSTLTSADVGITPAALTKTDDTNVTLTLGGTPATALLQATSITVGWAGVLGVTRGGTGLAAIAQGDLIYGSAANTFSILNKNATATRYLSNTGASNNPAWSQVDLSNGVTGTLPSANLGNGLARSVFGVTGNVAAARADIQGTTDQVLRVATDGLSLSFGTVATGGITNSAVTYAKIQNVSATSRFLGRITAGAGVVEELTGTQATSLLDLFSTTTTTKGVVPGSNNAGSTMFLRADGIWAVPPGGGGGGYTTLSQFVDETAWRIFYSNAAGDVTPLAFGTSGQVLQSTGATSAPIWATAGGSGTIGGTIAATQVGYGSGANTLTSSANFTFAVATGLLTLNTATGKLLQLGEFTAGASTTPVAINMGSSHSSVPGANLKLGLYDNGGTGATLGIGVTSQQMELVAPSGFRIVTYAGNAGGWTTWTDNAQLAINTNATLNFADSIGEKIRFYGPSTGSVGNYSMGIASITLYHNVPTGSKHTFNIQGAGAFHIGWAGATTYTIAQAATDIVSVIQLAPSHSVDAILVRDASSNPLFRVDFTGSVSTKWGGATTYLGVDRQVATLPGLWLRGNTAAPDTTNFTLAQSADNLVTLNAASTTGRILFTINNGYGLCTVINELGYMGIGVNYNETGIVRRLQVHNSGGNVIQPVARFNGYSGSTSAGLGAGIEFSIYTSTYIVGSLIGTEFLGGDSFDFVVATKAAGVDGERFRSMSTGEIKVQTLAQDDAQTKIAVWDSATKLMKYRAYSTFGTGTIGGSLAATQVAYGSAANTITGDALFTMVGGMLTVGKATGKNLQLGNLTALATSDPVVLSLGGTASNTRGSFPKLKLYEDGTSTFGLGASDSYMEYILPSWASHSFYAGAERFQVHQYGASILGSGTLYFSSTSNTKVMMYTTASGAYYDSVSLSADAASGKFGYTIPGDAPWYHSFSKGFTAFFNLGAYATSSILSSMYLYSLTADTTAFRIDLQASQTGNAIRVNDSGLNPRFQVLGGGGIITQSTLQVYGNGTFYGGLESYIGTDRTNFRAGQGALQSITTGQYNVAIGWLAGAAMTDAGSNIILGAQSGGGVTGSENTALGGSAMYCGGGMTGRLNVAIGRAAMYSASGNASDNIAVGYYALNGVSGGGNIAMGTYTLYGMTTGSGNIAIGGSAGAGLTTPSLNILIGTSAGQAVTVGANNVMIGSYSGQYATGSGNTYLGTNAGNNTQGDNNVFIGNGAQVSGAVSNQFVINNGSVTPLITGDFFTRVLNVNGQLNVTSTTGTIGIFTSSYYLGGFLYIDGRLVIRNSSTSGSHPTLDSDGAGGLVIYNNPGAYGNFHLNGNGWIHLGYENYGYANPESPLHIYEFTGAGGQLFPIVRLEHAHYTPTLPGMGVGILYKQSGFLAGYNGVVWGDTTAAAERFDYVVQLMNGGAVAAEKMRIKGTGEMALQLLVQDNALANVVVWDPTTKLFKYRAAGTIGGGAGGGYTTLVQFVDETAWQMFYSNGSGDVTPLALGTTNQVLTSTGISSAPIWTTPTTAASTKFGVAGQDNAAAENRTFNLINNSFEYTLGASGAAGGFLMGKSSVNNYAEISATIYDTGSTISAQVAVNRESTTGALQVNMGIASTATQNAQLIFKPGEALLQLGSASVFKIAGLGTAVGDKTLRYDTATGIVTYHDIPTGGGGGVSSFAFTNANGFSGSVATSTTTPTLTLTTTLLTGSVPFGGAAGALFQDNATFFWDTTNKRLGIGNNAPLYTLQVTGSAYAVNNFAHNVQGGWAAFLSNTTQVPASSSFTSGYTWAGGASSNTMQFAGSSTINQGAIIAGHTVSNRVEFTAASATITMTQAAGIRALAGLQILSQTLGAFAGTVSHGASLMIQGVYPVNSTVVTFQNYYGILINTLDEWGVVALTNRWAIYQQGASDPSYFAGRIQINNVTSQGAYMLQVTGGFYVNATTATMRFVGLSTDNAATQVLAKNTAGDNVWRDISSISGGVGGGENLDQTMAIGSVLTTNRTIDVGANALNITGTGTEVLDVTTTGTFHAIRGIAAGTASTGVAVEAKVLKPNTGDIQNAMYIVSQTTDAPTVGVGAYLRFFNPSGAGTTNQSGWLAVRRTVISTTVPQDDFEFWTQNAGTMAKSLVLKSTGHLLLGNLTSTTSATPISINLGGTFSTTINTAPKLVLYDNGAGAQYGIGIAASTMFYTVPAAVAHRFYVGTVTALMLGVGGGVGNYMQSPTLTDVTLQLFVDPSNTANAFEIKTGLVIVHSVSNAGNGYYAGNLSIANAKSFSGRIAPRIGTVASSSSLTIDSDAVDMYTVTALAATMVMNNPSGTPVDGQKLMIRIEDNGTTKTLTWSGTQWRAGDMALPLLTVATKIMYLGFTWHATDSKWDFIAYTDNF